MTLEEAEEFYAFLQGDIPDGIHADPLNLTPDQAFTVIWYLQEIPRIIPENYEICIECDRMFDANGRGYNLDEDAIDSHIQDARWPTYEWYCDISCLQEEIDRQAEIVFRRF